ncbi:Cof-type HAD-IIB family hydrolase [Limosilactobacillus sp.]|uniref:Cof-type HAD-IIB family hydrolase n=1 Tax=Limosilactobacillus sp. TaxID=2773925 RepID=UPI00345EF176
MAIKMIAIDIDQTLNNDQHEITPGVKAAINAATQAGIKVVLCTGRPMTGVRPYLQTLSLDDRDDQYVICFNGASAQTTSGKPLADYTLHFEDFLDWELFIRKVGVQGHIDTAADAYTPNQDINHYTVHEAYLANLGLHYRSMDQLMKMRNQLTIYKLMIDGHKEELDRVTPLIPEDFKHKFHIIRSEEYFIEFINPQANKGNALMELSKKLGIKQNETMALGNGGNDLSMIKSAGLGVAMANSIPDVLDAADEVTTDNNHDGVAAAIKKYALN